MEDIINKNNIIGVDFEGTIVRAGVVKNNQIKMLHNSKISVRQSESYVLNKLFDIIDKVHSKDISGIGLGVPSIVDTQAGIIYQAKNIPSWQEVHLKQHLEERYNVPVYVDNDANCFAIGEKYFGKVREYENIAGLIIGTGMGAGLVVDSKLLSGASGSAGEFGKIPYKNETFEYYCSEQFFVSEYNRTFEEILDLAHSKNKDALQILHEYGLNLGDAILSVMHTINPEAIIIGGSVSKAFQYFYDAMWQKISSTPYKHCLERLHIDVSEEPNIGILGAAALFLDGKRKEQDSENPVKEDVRELGVALRESENKYFKLFNRIADPVLIYDKATHHYLGCNIAVEKVYGYTPEELKALTPFDLHAAQDHRKLEKSINIRNKNFPFHFNHITKSGKKLEVEVIADEIIYDGREAMISIVRDVTDRKRVEDELRRSKNHLEEAKQQTDNILRHVAEGIFLLDTQYNIKSQYSSVLESILSQKSLANKNFLKTLEGKIPNDTLGSTAEFLELMFNTELEENMIRELNPLNRIEVVFNENERSEPYSKFLDFNFQRIFNRDNIVNEMMVTVIDTTNQVRLAEKLEKSEAKTRNQLEIVLVLLRVDPAMLNEFIDSANIELSKISELIQKTINDQENNAILEEIFRSVHTIKGNASLLNLKIFAEEAHAFEHTIEHLRHKTVISGNDIKTVHEKLDEMQQNYQEVLTLIDKIGRIHAQFRPKREYENKMLIDSLSRFIEQSSQEMGKQVVLMRDNFDINAIPHNYKLVVKEILIQLIRNSISHGIELPEERETLGKDPVGKIEICARIINGNFELLISDDGGGLQTKKLRERAHALGKWKKETIDKWKEDEVVSTIFVSGVSTAEKTSMISGRGVGMDIVKEKIEKMKGQIVVDHKAGQYCSFKITLPLEN